MKESLMDQAIEQMAREAKAKQPGKGEIWNVDLKVDLRIAGYGEPYMTITTDEGDGYEISRHSAEPIKTGSDEVTEANYIEWAGQLEECAKLLRKRAEKGIDK